MNTKDIQNIHNTTQNTKNENNNISNTHNHIEAQNSCNKKDNKRKNKET